MPSEPGSPGSSPPAPQAYTLGALLIRHRPACPTGLCCRSLAPRCHPTYHAGIRPRSLTPRRPPTCLAGLRPRSLTLRHPPPPPQAYAPEALLPGIPLPASQAYAPGAWFLAFFRPPHRCWRCLHSPHCLASSIMLAPCVPPLGAYQLQSYRGGQTCWGNCFCPAGEYGTSHKLWPLTQITSQWATSKGGGACGRGPCWG